MKTPSTHYAIMALVLLTVVTTVPAGAETLEIQFTGLDLRYENGDLTDAADSVGRNGDPAESDPLTTMSFLRDGVLIGTLDTDIYADLSIKGITIPDGPSLVYSSGNNSDFGFDLLTSQAGWGLALDINEFQLYYSGQEIAIAASGVAAGTFTQDLPFGITLDEDQQISIVISSSNFSGGQLSPDGKTVASFNASGTGSVSGKLEHPVPEPTSIMLLLLGSFGVAIAWCRMQRGK